MKKILILLVAAGLTYITPATAQLKDSKGNFIIGTTTDTAKANTTKTQTVTCSEATKGISVSYYLHQLTDTLTGYVSVWGSLDGSVFWPYPGADSVAISAATDVKKGWFLATRVNGAPVRAIQLRTRCASNTTNSTSKGKVTSVMYNY